MKKLTKSLILLIAAITIFSIAYAKENVIVDGHKWVNVMNPEGVKNGNGDFPFNDTCSIKAGGELELINSEEKNYLVKYTTKNDEEAFGALCPSGTIFYIGDNDYVNMIGKYEADQKREAARKKSIAEIIKRYESQKK